MSTTLKSPKATCIAVSLLATLLQAEAAGNLILIDAPPQQGYTLAIGPALVGQPEAPGSSGTKVTPIPGIDFYSSLGAFASTDDGLGWNFSRRQDLQLGVRLWPVFGRDDDRSRRRGLHDIGTRLGKGGFLNYAPWEFLALQTSVLAGSGDRGDGVQAEAGATVGEAALLGLTLGTTWANGPHLRSYYGVTPAESAAGGLPVCTPAAGWQDLNLALNGELRIDSRWKLSGQVLAARLVGDAKRSPVATSHEQTTFSLTLWYELR
jgi:outer membrane scaffolding protein for murein synthesis (MipA/OmpV family)